MDYVKAYGELIKKTAGSHPLAARRMIYAGLIEELIRMKIAPKKEMPQALRMLNYQSVRKVYQAIRHPENSCWTNIFAPVEIMQCFGLDCVSMECLSSFMSGFMIEDHLIDTAESEGIASTLCSYHKGFIGGVDSGIFPPAPLSVTTSMVCDGNINTFRHVQQTKGVPSFVIDVPNENSAYAMEYVTGQLKELITTLEKLTGKKMDMAQLRRRLEMENESKQCYLEFLKEEKHRFYPKTLTLELYLLFVTHLDIGSEDSLRFLRLLKEDVKKYPTRTGPNIFWVHLMPYYQQTLQKYFNYKDDYYIQAIDMNLDYTEMLDTEHPLEALARKMLDNIYNGPYSRKVEKVAQLVKELESDAVIHFCHWGCKQSVGGVMLLREKMQEMGIPMLVLDGDGMDRRNSHDGQIRTRLEAFLEMIDQMEGA